MTSAFQVADLVRSLIVRSSTPIMEVVEALNRNHKRIILVADDDYKLLGVVGDPDIRHAVLENVDFHRPVEEIMITTPVTVSPDTPRSNVLSLMEKTHCYQIPVTDQENRICDVLFVNDLLSQRDSPSTGPRIAIVMAGGLGQRLRPLTENTPKPLLKLGERPILFVILDQLLSAGIDKIYISLNYRGDQIREEVAAARRFKDIVFFLDEDKKLGTGGALNLLPERPTDSFLVINGDLLTNVMIEEMLRFHEFERNIVTVGVKEHSMKIPYGVVDVEGTRITGMREKPDHAFYINGGVYVVDPMVLDRISRDEFINMTDIVASLLESKLRVGCFPIHEYWLDIGEPDALKQAQSDYQKYFDANAEDE
jgi:dTDP-glucose pyrophosphorylase